MTVVARRLASVPVRTSVDTWTVVVELLTPAGGAARTELEGVTNIAAMLIAEEYTRDAPIVVTPHQGKRIRIYTVHGADAVDARDDEAPLAIYPLQEPGWAISLPCGIDDIDDIRTALDAHPNITVRDTTDGITVEATIGASAAGSLEIDYEEMERP
jgi:hypothetical protein